MAGEMLIIEYMKEQSNAINSSFAVLRTFCNIIRLSLMKSNDRLKLREIVFSDKQQNLDRFRKFTLPCIAMIVFNNANKNFTLDLEIPEICCKIEFKKFIIPSVEFLNNTLC